MLPVVKPWLASNSESLAFVHVNSPSNREFLAWNHASVHLGHLQFSSNHEPLDHVKQHLQSHRNWHLTWLLLSVMSSGLHLSCYEVVSMRGMYSLKLYSRKNLFWPHTLIWLTCQCIEAHIYKSINYTHTLILFWYYQSILPTYVCWDCDETIFRFLVESLTSLSHKTNN